MSLHIKEAHSEADLKAFVDFQFKLYHESKLWVPPIKKDEIKMLSPKTNPAFEECKAKFWLAYNEGVVVGRIGAIINPAYCKKVNKNIGRITRLEFIEDIKILKLLLSTAEEWLKAQGMTEVHGPLGFNNLDSQGMLVEGFEYLPSIASPYHFAYYAPMMEQCSYGKEIDWVEFRLTVGEQAVQKATRGAQLIQKRYGIEVTHFKKTDELLPYGKQIFGILNGAFEDLPFVTPFSDKLIAFYTEKFLKLVNPEFVKMVKLNGEMIGFVIGMPSLSKAMQKAHGKLFPFGFIHILQARGAKGVDTMDQMLTGVKPEHQSTGAAVILMAELQNVMMRKGMKYIETTGIFETNTNAISNWKNYEHIQHKRRRCWIKPL